jgi:hypothetical protein
VVLYEKYMLDRMAQVYGVAAQVFAVSDPKKSGEFISKLMGALFPEIESGKDHDVSSKLAELKAFSEKTIMLVPTQGGFSLKMEDGKLKGK